MKIKNGMWCNANLKNYEALKNLGFKMEDTILNALKYKSNFYIKDNIVCWGHKKCIGAIHNKNYWNKDKEIKFKKPKNEIEVNIKLTDIEPFKELINLLKENIDSLPTELKDKLSEILEK